MELWGKTVKVEDRDILLFFYPSLVIRDVLTVFDRDKDVLYVGKYRANLKEYLQRGARRFISVVGVYDIDFTDRRELVKFVLQRDISRGIAEYIDSLSPEEFYREIKIAWVLKRLHYEEEDRGSYLEFLKALSYSEDDALKNYFSLESGLGARRVESMFLGTLSKIFSESSDSPIIKNLRRYRNKLEESFRGYVMSFDKYDSSTRMIKFILKFFDVGK